MATIVVTGGGLVGLCTAMLLAKDGHEVTVLERDPAPPPDLADGAATAEAAWDGWQRRGVNQFRQLHYFQPRFRQVIDTELPAAAAALRDAGALRFNILELVPESVSGGVRDGDDRYGALTGRRPVVEAAMAAAAAATPGLTVRRGEAVAALRTGPSAIPGVPHVVGVRTAAGEDLDADLVVDATGRRSPLPAWLAAAGARPPAEEADDCGFVYYGRHFRSADGSVPPMFGSLLQAVGSLSVLTLPADHGTWGVGLVASGRDTAMRALRDPERWMAVARSFPLQAHWVEAEPIDEDIAVMAAIEDRIRHFCVDGTPVATGVVAVGDSWACTNPSVGRGASIGILHAQALRDLLRTPTLDDAAELPLAWADVTERTVAPWYQVTLALDRTRLAEVDAAVDGRPHEVTDPTQQAVRAIQFGSGSDPELLRAQLEIFGVLRTDDDVLSDPDVAARVAAVGDAWRDAPSFGPTREQLLEMVQAGR